MPGGHMALEPSVQAFEPSVQAFEPSTQRDQWHAAAIHVPSRCGAGAGLSSMQRLQKAIFDYVLTIVLLMVLAIPLACIAVLIKLTSSGPVFFVQERQGKNGVVFRCFKFRTMNHETADYACLAQTSRNDTRITRIGRVLRKTSLDEFPQLWNVILGNMSLIGPRPHALGMNVNGRPVREISENYHLRLQVKPGITGWAQVNGWRGILDTEEKVKRRVACDLYYIDRWSIWLDVRILLRTPATMFGHQVF
jgi:lipopolysaccharide/colanic/teichoic acid biosynthesis glycosyltransferase